jgi:hypothetical protein
MAPLNQKWRLLETGTATLNFPNKAICWRCKSQLANMAELANQVFPPDPCWIAFHTIHPRSGATAITPINSAI